MHKISAATKTLVVFGCFYVFVISAVEAEDITLNPLTLKTQHHSLDIVTTESN